MLRFWRKQIQVRAFGLLKLAGLAALVLDLSLFFVYFHHIYAEPYGQYPGLSTLYNAPSPSDKGTYSPTTLLVKFKPTYRANLRGTNPVDTGIASINTILERHNVTGFKRVAVSESHDLASSDLFGWYEVTLSSKLPIAYVIQDGVTVYPALDQLQSALESNAAVEEVSKSYTMQTSLTPNDPFWSSSGSWGQSFNDLWGLQDINPTSAWNQTTGSGSVTVAEIDTGIDNTQPDISANIDEAEGWNWCNNNSDTMDDNGHGTHVAGILDAVGNNGQGIAGVSWHVTLMPLKFLCANGQGSDTNGAAALQYAADHGAQISSNSWGCECADDPLVDDAVAYEHAHNMVTVVAAGNNSGNALDDEPAMADGAIVVGAVDNTNTIASFSNYGEKVDVVAPGVQILSLKSSEASSVCVGSEIVDTNYCEISGTSMATPFVSGLAALMLSKNPSLTNEQVRQILRTTATPLGSGTPNNTYGYGLINVTAAVNASASPTVLAPYISSPSSRSTFTGEVTITGSANGSNFSSYKVLAGQGRTPSSWVTLINSSTSVTNGTLISFDSSTLPDNNYTFELVATNTNGIAYTYSIYDVNVYNFDAAITAPFNLTAISSSVQIEGQADISTSGLIFSHYTLDYGIGTNPTSYTSTGITLANGGTTQETVNTDTLGNWDTTGLSNNTTYTLRLTVYATNGSDTITTSIISADSTLLPGWPKYIPGTNCTIWCLGAGEVFADLEGNGQQEVIIPAATNKIYAYYKNGTPVAGWPVTVTPGDYFENAPTIAYLDGTLKPDLIIEASISGTTNKRLYIIRSDGTLYPGWPTPVIDAYGVGDDPMPSVADLDNNGTEQLVMITWDSVDGLKLNAYNLNGTQLAGYPKTINYGDTPYLWLMMPPTIANLDGTGYPDIIFANYDQLFVFDHNGNELPGWPVTIPMYNGNLETIQGPPSIGDLDNNGQLEIICTGEVNGSNNGEVAYAYHIKGALLSGWPYLGSTMTESGGFDIATAAIADVEGDSKDDVIIGSWGAGIIEDGVGRISNPYFAMTASPSIADFNGDGNLKFPGIYNHGIQWGNNNFSVFWSNNNLNNLATENPGAATVAVGDLTRDNHEDFGASIKHNNEIYIYLWEQPGTTNPIDSWPMFAHDPQHTDHYSVGQVTDDTTPPQVVITTPTTGINVSGNVSLAATAIDSYSSITKVEFYANSSLVATSNTWPYEATWNATGDSPGNYSLTAKAYDTAGNTADSPAVLVYIADTTPPTAPTNLQSTAQTDTTISFSWTASTDNVGVTGYHIYRNGTLIATQAGTTYTDIGLVPITQYTYVVEAYDAAGNNSSETSVEMTSAADTTPPSVPTNLQAINVTYHTLTVTWSAATDDVVISGYDIYQGTNLIGTTTNLSYPVSSLSTDTGYSFTVVAYDEGGNLSPVSASLSVTTPKDATPPVVIFSTPSNNATLSNSVLITGSAYDDDAMSSLIIMLDGSLVTSNLNTINYILDTTKLSNSQHTLSLTGTDASGNTTTIVRTISVSNAVRLPGDVNGDGKVDILDLSLLLSHFGQNYPPAEFASGNVVNILDLSLLLSHYGT